MRFGLVHRILVDSLATLGILAVVSSASMSPWASVIAIAGLALALAVPETWQQRPIVRTLATVAPLLLLFVEAGRLAVGTSAIDVAVEFAVLLQVIRLATRRGAAHDQQITVLALLHFVVGTVLGGGLAFGLCFFGFLLVAPGALVLSHLRREVEGNYRQGARDRTGLPVDVPRILRSRRVVGRGFLLSTSLLSVPIFLFTATLFLLFPRVGLSLLLVNHTRSGRMVGFSDHVDLGDVGMLRSDPTIALRFEPAVLSSEPPARLTLRFRGTAFDYYDGRAWARTQTERHPADHIGDTYTMWHFPSDRDSLMRVDLEPIDPPVLFIPPRSTALRLRTGGEAPLGAGLALQRGPEGELRYSGSETRGLHYDVYVAPDLEALPSTLLPSNDRQRYLALPSSVSERIRQLAISWTLNETTPTGKARALETHLRHEFQYDTNSPSGGQSQPVDHFLFESKRGHCEFFSTSMAVMLRAVDIPSRNVTGFVGGTYNRFGHYYAVREGDAHSWVEAFIEVPILGNVPSTATSGSWTTFDPTPSAGSQPQTDTTGVWAYLRDVVEAASQRWDRNVVGYDIKQQMGMFDGVTQRYNAIRAKTGTDHGFAGQVTRPKYLTLAAVLAVLAAYLIFKFRRRSAVIKLASATKSPERAQLDVIALYTHLEMALRPHGLLRNPAESPLRFATNLAEHAPHFAPKVLTLTEIYLGVRFGGDALTQEIKFAFDSAIASIKATPRGSVTHPSAKRA